MAIVHGDITGRISTYGTDPHGRWAYFTLAGPAPITVLTTYQVCSGNPQQSGPGTYATQLLSSYIQEGRNEPYDLRKHHANNLIQWVKTRQAAGEAIIIAGDLNEVLGTQNNGLTRLCTECNLVDVIQSRHHEVDFATHQTGLTVIDYVLMDPALLLHVHSTGYEPFYDHIASDHRGAFVDFNTLGLFHDQPPPPSTK